MAQVQGVEGGYCIRAGEAGENGEIEGANELVFTDANFNVKFRVKLDFDFDRFELATDGPDGWRGHFINEPNELRVLDLRREADGFEHGKTGDLESGEHDDSGKFAHDKAEEFRCDEADEFNRGGSGEFTQGKASKSGCEATDKFEYDEPFKFKLGEQVQYLAAKSVLAHKFKKGRENFRRRYGCFLPGCEHKIRSGAKGRICRTKFSVQRRPRYRKP